MRNILIAVVLVWGAVTAFGQEREAVEKAAMQYSMGCSGGDARVVYEAAAPEVRLILRSVVATQSAISIVDTPDIDGFVSAVKNFDQNLIDETRSMGVILMSFTRIVDVEIKDSLAWCYVKAAPPPAKANRRDPLGREPWGGRRVLISSEKKRAETTAPSRAEATHVITLRKDAGEWKVSMALRVKAIIEDLYDNGEDRPRESGAADVADVLGTPAGDVTIGEAIKAVIADVKTFSGAGMVDIYGNMSDGFQTFLKGKLGKPVSQTYIDFSVQRDGPKVYLLNADEPAITDPDAMTDERLWALILEYAESKHWWAHRRRPSSTPPS